MNKFGITGGIGSGKTYISHLLEERGFSIFNCDSAARELMLVNTELQEHLSLLIGKPVLTPAGTLDKKAIGTYLFASAENVARVNALVHPLVRDAFRNWVKQRQLSMAAQTGGDPDLEHNPVNKWAGMECSILFEAGFNDLVDVVACVTAPEKVRLERVEKRDGLTPAMVEQRIRQQWPEDEKSRRSDFIFNNDGVHALDSQVSDFINLLSVGRVD